MNEIQFKRKLEEALREPSVPSELLEKTVSRAKTLESGLIAERRLREGEDDPSERASLLADCLIGRIARSGKLPLGADGAAMKEKLMNSERFRLLSRQEPKAILAGLDSGKLMGESQPEKSSASMKNTRPKRGPSM